MGMCLLATSLIMSPKLFHFRYEKLLNISRLLLVPIVDANGHITGYHIPLTELGKASKLTLDGTMHVTVTDPDLVIMIQFLDAATRKMAAFNAVENANNGMCPWQAELRYSRFFAGQRISSTYAAPESGEFTQPILRSLPYVPSKVEVQLPSQLRKNLAERFLKKNLPQCSTKEEVTKCIGDLARIMESNSRNIIQSYTNFVMMTPLRIGPARTQGVLKKGLIDFITQHAQPHMFHDFEEGMRGIEEAFGEHNEEEKRKLLSAYRKSLQSQSVWETKFYTVLREVENISNASRSSSSSSSSSSSDFYYTPAILHERIQHLVQEWERHNSFVEE